MVGGGIFQRGHHFGAAQLHFDQHIGEGQQCERGVHAQATGGHGHAHTACVLQGKVGAFGGKQEGFGHHLGGIAATGQGVGTFAASGAGTAVGAFAGYAHQAQRLGGGADGLGLFGGHLVAVGFEGGGCGGIGRDDLDQRLVGGQVGQQRGAHGVGNRLPGPGGILALELVADQQGGFAAAALDFTGFVQLHVQQAKGLAVFPGLPYAHGLAVFVGGHGGVAARRAGDAHRSKVAQQAVRVATDDRIHIGQFGGHGLVGLVALVGDGHDVAHALGLEFVNGLLGRCHFFVECGGGQRARGVDGFARDGDADQAHLHTVDFLDDPGLEVGRTHRGSQCRACGGHHVAGNDRGVAAAFGQLVQKAFERGIAVVKLVVAGGEGIEADGVHHLRIDLALEEGVVQRAGVGIARMDFEQVGRAGCHLLEHGRLPGKAAQIDLGGHAVQRQFGGRKGIEL